MGTTGTGDAHPIMAGVEDGEEEGEQAGGDAAVDDKRPGFYGDEGAGEVLVPASDGEGSRTSFAAVLGWDFHLFRLGFFGGFGGG